MKNQLIDARDFISAALRLAIYVPLYKAVAAAERKNIRVPFKIVHLALHSSSRAKGDWNDMKSYYFG